MVLYGERKYGVKCTNYVSLKKLFKLCRILNNEIGVKVKMGKHLYCEFKFIIVLRQVDAIVPFDV
jgi:hypothetical protein